jgi:hydrogenase maturation protease
MKRVVLGVGNTIMGDEGVGVRCVEWLAPHVPPDVFVVDGGTSTHELLGDIEEAELLIIVDAIATTLPPGSNVRLEGDRIPSAFSNKLSPHQHGINDLLAALALLGKSPKRLVLFGIAPERIELGMELTAAVSAVVPEVGRRVLAELA